MAGEFGERVRLSRSRLDWTQDELARRAGVGVATIRRAEGATFEPRLETARRLADALGVDMKWLMFGDDEVPANEI